MRKVTSQREVGYVIVAIILAGSVVACVAMAQITDNHFLVMLFLIVAVFLEIEFLKVCRWLSWAREAREAILRLEMLGKRIHKGELKTRVDDMLISANKWATVTGIK